MKASPLSQCTIIDTNVASGPDPDKKDEEDTRKVPRRSIFDAKHVEAETDLPGELVRSEGEGKGKDMAVNAAYDNVGHVLDFYKDEFHWKSIDNNDADVVSSVHFGQGYQNACEIPLFYLPILYADILSLGP